MKKQLLKRIKTAVLIFAFVLNSVAFTGVSVGAEDISLLTYESITNGQSRLAITENLTLGGEEVTWSSSNEDVIATDGTVTRPAVNDEVVTLTASSGNETEEFEVVVLSRLSTVISTTEFENADVLSNYTVNDQGATVPVEYANGSIQALYSTVTVENGIAKLVPRDGKMSTINRKNPTDALTGNVVIEKRVDVTDGFDYEIKNSLGKRVIKLQASGGKLYSYSNYNTTDVTLNYALPAGFFDLKIIADTDTRTFTLYIDGEIPSADFENKAFMAESSGAYNISADKIFFGGFLRTADKPVFFECETIKTVADIPTIDDVANLLTDELILGENASLDMVETDLVLKNSYEGLYDAEILWSVSSNSGVLNENGTVVRGNNDETVILTATILFNDEQTEKTFNVVVKRKPVNTDLTEAGEKLTYEAILKDGVSPHAVTNSGDITLPDMIDDTEVVWESSNENIVSADGTVTPAELSDREITLTATLTNNGESIEKSFEIIVLSQNSELIYAENFDSPDSIKNYILLEGTNRNTYSEETGSVKGSYAEITFDSGAAKLTPADANSPSSMIRLSDKESVEGLVVIRKKLKITRGFDLEVKNSLGKRVIKLQSSGNKLMSYSNYNTVNKSVDYAFSSDYVDIKIVADTENRVFTLYVDGEIPHEEFYNHPFMAESSDAYNINPGEIFLGAYPRTSQYPVYVDSESVSTMAAVLTEDEIFEILNEELILGENEAPDRITKNLKLKSSYDELPYAEIIWSSNSSAISTDGSVNRDSIEDTDVSLTAQISYDGYTYIKNFDFTVISEKTEIQILIDAVTEDLVVADSESADAVSTDLNLEAVKSLFENAEITWSSSDESVISSDGRVTLPALVDRNVTMCANIVINLKHGDGSVVTYVKELSFTVKHKETAYMGNGGNRIFITSSEEVVSADSVTLKLGAQTENADEKMCLVVYAYNELKKTIEAIDFDEKVVDADGENFEVSVNTGSGPGITLKYFVWDSLTSHKPLCNLSPSYPLDLSGEATAYDTVTTVWGEAADDFSDISKYIIYSDGVYEGETTERIYNVDKLDKGQIVIVDVSAVDSNGNESQKSSIALKTEKMPISIADGDNIILPKDSSVRFYVETRKGYYGYTEAGRDENGVGYRITTRSLRGETEIISRVPLTLSDNFINENAGKKDFAIEVTYFDEGTETLRVSYDDFSGEVHGTKSITMTDSKMWKTSTIIINDANFKKSSNNGNSYANIMVYTPSAGLKVRALGIMPLEEFSRDSVGFNVENGIVVSRECALGINDAEVTEIAGREAVKTSETPIAFRSLGISENEVVVEVYYYDSFKGNLYLKYNTNGNIKKSLTHKTEGTNTWKKAKFTISDAVLNRNISDTPDISVLSDRNDLYVSSVRIIAE